MLAKPDLQIISDGNILRGFDQVSIQFGMSELFGEFDLSIRNRWTDSGDLPFKAGSACIISLSGQHILSGFIEYISQNYGPDGSGIELYGRSGSVDLAESRPDLKSNEFRGEQTLKAISDKLFKPLGVWLESDPETEALKLKNWKLEPGERVGDNLIRMAQKLQLQVYGLPKGFVFAGGVNGIKPTTSITQGRNLMEIQSSIDHSDLYHSYLVRSQEKDDTTGKTRTVTGKAKHKFIRSQRTMLIQHDGLSSESEANKLAEWEMQVRQAQAYQCSVKVPGWFSPEGTPWEINTLVHVDCYKASVKKDLLIYELSFDYSQEEGHTTTLELRHPDTLKPKPHQVKPDKKAEWAAKVAGLL